jgi:hypothetical protein
MLERALRVLATQGRIPAEALLAGAAWRANQAEARSAAPPILAAPTQEKDPPPIRVPQAVDLEELFVENAGLVVLWPFFVYLFERLGLMENKQFVSRAALHRAVALLAHLASGERTPIEYQATLPKVLCGMELDEVLCFDPPITDDEAEECENLLGAVIQHAQLLGELSVADLRAWILARNGVLGTRDGAWLLRIERLEAGEPLDRIPWGLSWVKLPWTDEPLHVEW